MIYTEVVRDPLIERTLRTVFLRVASPSGGTHISQVEGDLQVVPEHIGEVGIHVQHFQQVVSQDLVKVTVGQSPDISARFTWPPIQTDGFSKDVVLSYGNHNRSKEEHVRRARVSRPLLVLAMFTQIVN